MKAGLLNAINGLEPQILPSITMNPVRLHPPTVSSFQSESEPEPEIPSVESHVGQDWYSPDVLYDDDKDADEEEIDPFHTSPEGTPDHATGGTLSTGSEDEITSIFEEGEEKQDKEYEKRKASAGSNLSYVSGSPTKKSKQ
jgi:hypothetical protein